MIRLQDIADMAGVSRTTVSNVINGNTKRVSQKTIDKITAILKEQNYVPHMGSVMLSGHGSRIIGVVLGFAQAHGMYSLQDSFVGELQMEAEMKGYYVMLIGGENIQNVVDIASRWNVEGLIILGYNDEKYRKLSRKLNKKMVLIDAYPAGEYFFQNVGVDDYSGGYQIGSYLCSCGFDKALFLAETDIDSDYSRWMGFKQAMEKEGKFCSRTRLIVIPGERNRRIQKYKELLPRFLQVKAVAFSSDYAAIEAMNFLSDHGIKVPEQVSVTGFDDSIYARMVRPRLTTVHQDVGQKAHLAFSRLLRMVAGEQLKEFNIKSPVYLVKRDSVKILEELVIHITNGENDIYLGYNCTFQGKKASKAEVDEKGAVQYSTEQLRPDIFLILNKEIFFACDAKYKNYSKEFMGIQAWYTDLFECGAYKYIYRLNLGNVTDENSGKCMLPVKKKFVGEDSLKPVLKNGGVCILTPAISDSDMPSYYNGFEIDKKYETFLELLQEGKVNRDYSGCEILDSREYTCKLKEAICGEDGRESKYEYRIASTKFLLGNDRGFYNLFYEAFEYGQAHFLKAVF